MIPRKLVWCPVYKVQIAFSFHLVADDISDPLGREHELDEEHPPPDLQP